jgi:hypothetical protein
MPAPHSHRQKIGKTFALQHGDLAEGLEVPIDELIACQ